MACCTSTADLNFFMIMEAISDSRFFSATYHNVESFEVRSGHYLEI